MFTLEQIKAAHSKVKSGADFPNYIRDIKQLGVLYYETFVSEGNTEYFGDNNYSLSSPARHDRLIIEKECRITDFKKALKEHQQGMTDYPTFIQDCARNGIEKWIVRLDQMTCTYFDTKGNEMLVERIPS